MEATDTLEAAEVLTHEVVADSKMIAKVAKVDEATSDQTVVEEEQPLLEVEARANPPTHDSALYLHPDLKNVDGIPPLINFDAVTYLDHGLFPLHETKTLVLYLLLSSSFLLFSSCIHHRFSLFSSSNLILKKEKFSTS